MKNNGWLTISISTALSWLMKFIMIGMLPYVIYKETYLFAFATAVAIILSLLPSIVERNYRITLPFELDLLITLMIFLHTFFGEWLKFYDRLWVWVKILHKDTQNGLDNTMWDVINDLIGGTFVASMGIIYMKYSRPVERKRLTKPLGEIFGIKKK